MLLLGWLGLSLGESLVVGRTLWDCCQVDFGCEVVLILFWYHEAEVVNVTE